MTTLDQNLLVPVESIAQSILVLRGQKVILDADLAELYGVETKRFNEQVRRNLERFPDDFMFQLSGDEWAAWGRRRYAPYVVVYATAFKENEHDDSTH